MLPPNVDPSHSGWEMLERKIHEVVDPSGGEVAVHYRDLGSTDAFDLAGDVPMHAASTMKVPVMIQLFKDREAGLLSFDDTVRVKTTFASFVDGSPFVLAKESDSDATLYSLQGQWVTYRHLIELMITVSSNLATNLLMEVAGAERVTASMRGLGAGSMVVLRGVEDGPAFRAGLINTTTARDLGAIMEALGRGEAVSPEASREMLEIMGRQQFRTKIPANLPEGVRVAHKTGSITGISHDAGLVFPGGAPAFALVILTRGFDDQGVADALAARISRLVYDNHLERHEQTLNGANPRSADSPAECS